MDICAATIFCSPNHTPVHLIKWINAARTAFHLPVSQLLLATTPFNEWLPTSNTIVSYAAKYEKIWLDQGIDALSLGTLQIRRDDAWLEKIVDIIGGTTQSHFSVALANDSNFIDIGRINAISCTIKKLSDQSAQALQRLTPTAHYPTGAPWQQVATSNGILSFSLAIDLSDLILQTFAQPAAEQTLVATLAQTVQKISAEAAALSAFSGIPFKGLDFTFTLPHSMRHTNIWALINQVEYPHYANGVGGFCRKQLPHPHQMSSTELSSQYNALAAQAATTRTPLMIQHMQPQNNRAESIKHV